MHGGGNLRDESVSTVRQKIQERRQDNHKRIGWEQTRPAGPTIRYATQRGDGSTGEAYGAKMWHKSGARRRAARYSTLQILSMDAKGSKMIYCSVQRTVAHWVCSIPKLRNDVASNIRIMGIDDLSIYYRLMASGNSVMKDGYTARDSGLLSRIDE